MKKKLLCFLLITSLLGTIPLGLAASSNYYASTVFYFNIPSDATFSISMPPYSSNTSITGTTQGGATATTWISFNLTSVPQSTLTQPYVQGASANAQVGLTKPIMWIFNTGNVNITLSTYLGAAAPTGNYVFFNGTCVTPATTCTTPTTTLTAMTTSSQNIVASLYTNQAFNLTYWANTSSAATSGQSSATVYINSSSTS